MPTGTSASATLTIPHAAQMDRKPELKIIRRAFAKQVMAACGIRNPRVEAAFAVAREDFLGPGPWQIVRWGGGYRATPECQCRREAARGCMARRGPRMHGSTG
jgi:hypothetical protein